MQEVSGDKPAVMSRISAIVDSLFKRNSLFRERLDQDETIQFIVSLFEKFSLEEFEAIDDINLLNRIDKILLIEAVAGTLNDLTPGQLKIFDEAVEGR